MSDNARRRCGSHQSISRALFAALTVLAVAAASPARASDDDDDVSFSDPGLYVGVSGVYTHNFFDAQVDDAISDLFAPAKVDASIDDSWGLNARVGYRAVSWFAIEAEYEYIDEFDVHAKVQGVIPNTTFFSIEGHALTANVRFIAPVWRTQPYLLLGAGYALYESDVRSFAKPLLGSGGKESGFAGRAGGGIDFYLTEHIVANAEVTALVTTQDFGSPDTGNIDDLYYMSIGGGLRYQF